MIQKKRFETAFYKVITIISGIHALIAILYRSCFYHYNEEDTQYFNFPVHVRETFLSGSEKEICAFLSAVAGVILIWTIWYILLRSIKERRKGVFVIIAASIVLGVLLFPNCFGIETDTFEMYGMAVRNLPHYWHNIYTTCFYNACLLVFPQPVILPVIQLSALLGTLYYLALRLKKIFGEKTFYLPWLILLFPGVLQLAVSTYRNCINTIMCMAFFSLLFCDAVEKRKRSFKELFIIGICCSFLTIYRSEQILLLFIYVIALYFVYDIGLKKTICALGMMIIISMIMILPQKQGEEIYYGKDYSIINQLDTLSMMFQEKEIDLEYDGVAQDLEALENIVPVEKIKRGGSLGYRGHVYTLHGSINQSFAEKETQNAFIRATHNIILHNPMLFLKTRIWIFLNACGLGKDSEVDATKEIEDFYQAYEISVVMSEKQMYEDTWVKELWNNKKIKLTNWMIGLNDIVRSWIESTSILLVLGSIVFFAFAAIIYSCRKEKYMGKESVFWIITALLLYMQTAGIVLLSPEGRSVYYFPVFFIIVIGDMVLILFYTAKKRS